VSYRLALLLAAVALTSASAAAQSELNPAPPTQQPVFAALQKAYPDWITLGSDQGAPTILVRGRPFLWAEGRLLPPSLAERWADYAPQPFYPYPYEVPDVASWSDEKIADTETRLADRRNSPPHRHSGFFDALWQVSNRADAEDAQRSVRFLGFRVTVHAALAAPLARVEARLTALRAKDPSLDAFLRGLDHLDGYNWRDIAETQSRSNHAYGVAIDLIPRSFGGKIPYWLWAPQDNPGWYRLAWAARWEPHRAVVEAFEAEGFIWGGKWMLFDTIHFEYRPEILVLAGLR
jgi:hypothetical protein